MKFAAAVNFQQIPVTGLVPETASSPPASPVPGQMRNNSITGKDEWWDNINSVWRAFDDVAPGTVTDAKVSPSAAIQLSKLAVNPLARANHTGTQLSSTISDFASAVEAIRLDQMAAPTASVSMNGQTLTNLNAPVNPTDAARLTDLQAAAAGLNVKDPTRAATTGAITLSGTQTVDGVALNIGDRVLVKDQSDQTTNGLYTVAAGSWTRTSDNLAPGTFVLVTSGTTHQDQAWVISNSGTITVGTTAITWSLFSSPASVAAGNGLSLVGGSFTVLAADSSLSVSASGVTVGNVSVAKGGTGSTTAAGARSNLSAAGLYTVTLGAVTAGTPVTVTHNLNNSYPAHVAVWETSGGALVYPDVASTGANTITITSAVAYGAGALQVTVSG